ncbi:4Fe-4S dicluster domain-containing protein [Cnuella takakiae]|uniref:4Fe-4S dicluster domain-containing protein n=1 Tax=Cnuella takakiae TaxID=1302690 RepID=A0A1M5GJJ2_9BACT|nr:4Fe-4S dicluster domain-containing protein [Cnuella takakiae]OLY92434.1 Fe-S oxidoreductase [Cnuella takakiae]SHG03691.1 4Fe-4S dicluster domain-containing protein [Cnuella takakiae]
MELVQQILFLVLAAAAIFIFAKKVKAIRRNINLGREEDIKPHPDRWRNVLLMAFGQKRMFDKPLVALMHFILYAGFIIINIEVLEIVLDGLLGTHRLFAGVLGGFYAFVINFFEILAVLVLVTCVAFLARRNILKVRRLNMAELNGWPRSDANIILTFEIVLMSLFLLMNGADRALQLQGYGHYAEVQTNFWISGLLAPALQGLPSGALVGIERIAWWLHIVGIFAFLNYLPYSKHLHIILAFPNTYYAKVEPQAEMTNMPEIQREVLYAMEPDKIPAEAAEAPKKFGAKDVTDLSWKNLLDAYTCTECGRCTEACPANQTGKKLSPRKIMMDTRDRVEELGATMDGNSGSAPEGGKNLLHDYITTEELWACTSCQACVQACPVLINPLSIINQMKRYLALEESNQPGEWNGMYSNVENNFAPWKFAPDDRDRWAEELMSKEE